MTIREKVEYVTGEKFSGLRLQTGKIVSDSGKAFFLKTGPVAALRCEANGLYELSKAAAIWIPRVIAVDEEFLLTEYMDGRPPGGSVFSGSSAGNWPVYTGTQPINLVFMRIILLALLPN